MNDEQQAALEALEAALAKCMLAKVPDNAVGDTFRHSRDKKMSITLITDDGKLNNLWVNEAVEQSDHTLEEIVDTGITLMAQHATRVNLFLNDFRQNKEYYVDGYRTAQARYIPKPGYYHNPVPFLFIRTGNYGRSTPTSLAFSSTDKFRRSRPTDSHGSLWGAGGPMPRILGPNGWTPPSVEELKDMGFSTDHGLTAEQMDDLIFHPQPKD